MIHEHVSLPFVSSFLSDNISKEDSSELERFFPEIS